ncbi:unnamed protein product [Didymodactylos carnosus]|uniref:RING-type E3 ubiquitin transferase n=1 Tax=Didymodactylos carnosus TaxID=1234261 RepID=A0A813X792_9BILA|nr:unnamed protein product [Didymodactylos carnosus]CAF0865677.1 unnamed protein product [Didymodactylos carnosus]CAF3571401.1 unnamed protein product [Didymodactylos carnosus]CAF3653177.1 unnamed protein product [Didymodactylos carnosus]
MLEVGIRVVRGPDWKWGNQDDGEGHVGTVVEIGKPGSSTSPDKTVVVQWDSGSRTNYRVGYQNAFDLRVFDNAQIGVRHPNVICDSCRKHGILGMRWKCGKCFDFDLCTQCYMQDKHDLTHPFIRFETSTNTQGYKLQSRQQLPEKVLAKGIFKGAMVVRGADWDWNNQDGGNGQGKVTEIKGWERESGRSVATVQWTHNQNFNVYRVGHKGKVDLKYVQEAKNGNYYKMHLPVLGEHVERLLPPVLGMSLFSIGEKVRVMLDLDLLKQLQEGHGGWNIKMADVIGKIGCVHRVTDRGDIRVQFDGLNNRWTFHPGALTKVHAFLVGDYVKISPDEDKVRLYQKGHGEWSEGMQTIVGRIGKVIQVYSDGDIRVSCLGSGQIYTFNPLCCLPIPKHQVELQNTIAWNEHEWASNSLANSCKQLQFIYERTANSMGAQDEEENGDIVRLAAQGKYAQVRDLLVKNPQLVDYRSGDKSSLMVSSHQGHLDVVKLLLTYRCNLELKDSDGDTALHYSCFGNQSDCMDLLISKGADINSVNLTGCSTLHIAVNKQFLTCTKILLKYQHQLDINLQDVYGDTAVHDIANTRVKYGSDVNVISDSTLSLIQEFENQSLQNLHEQQSNYSGSSSSTTVDPKDSRELIDLILQVPNVNFSLKNKRGFNVLHHAALKGNSYVTSRLITICRQLVDSKKDDAALNGHKDVTSLLLREGHADIEIVNNRKQTALHLAVSQGHTSIIELLIVNGAKVNVLDEDGDTPLHLILSKQQQVQEPKPGECDQILEFSKSLPSEFRYVPNSVIAAYLVKNEAPLLCKNRHDRMPLDYIAQEQPRFKEYLTLLNRSIIAKQIPTTFCMICDESAASILFEPCKHKVACYECCLKMKRCVLCQLAIEHKYQPDGQSIAMTPSLLAPSSKPQQQTQRHGSVDKLKELESKVQELEDSNLCSICMERQRNVAFLCGHTACSECSQPLKTCHICRKQIMKKINLYS